MARAGMGLRRLIGRLHLVFGLTLGLVAVLLGLTGTVLVFRAEIDRALYPQLYRVTAGAQKLPWQQLIDVAQAESVVPPKSLNAPSRADEAVIVTLGDGREAFVDPYRGTLLGLRDADGHPMAVILDLHRHLLTGDAGNQVVGIAAAGLVIISLSGLVLWWPRSRAQWRRHLTIQRGHSRRVLVFSLHRSVGAYGLILLVMLGFTGAAFVYRDAVTAVYGLLTASSAQLPVPKAGPADGRPAINADRAIAIAQARFPTADFSWIRLPQKANEALRVIFRQPGEAHPLGKTTVFVDPYSAQVLDVIDPFHAPAAWRLYYAYNYAWHTGEIYGWPTRLLVLLASPLPALLFVTGLQIRRSKRRRGPEAPSPPAVPSTPDFAPLVDAAVSQS